MRALLVTASLLASIAFAQAQPEPGLPVPKPDLPAAGVAVPAPNVPVPAEPAFQSGLDTERPLAFIVTGPPLAPGEHEVLVGITPRLGRTVSYLRLDNQIGFGFGVRRNIDLQVLIPISIETVGLDGRSAEGGVATRWRWQMLDPLVDLLGFSIFTTAAISPVSVSFEARVGAEKWLGDFLFALNASADFAVRRDDVEVPELHLEQSGGIVYRLANRFTSGFEVRNRLAFDRGDYFGDAIFAGPVFGFRARHWWASFGFYGQVAAVKASELYGNGEALELRDNERFVLRLQAGFEAF